MKKLFIILAILAIIGASYASPVEEDLELQNHRILRGRRCGRRGYL